MEKKIYYCDYCGARISKRPKTIRTIWSVISSFGNPLLQEEIAGDGCSDCFKSFKAWVKSRDK